MSTKSLNNLIKGYVLNMICINGRGNKIAESPLTSDFRCKHLHIIHYRRKDSRDFTISSRGS